jgi:UDP-glucose 6-dehydrogenase
MEKRELNFNEWNAYLLLQNGRFEAFDSYCENCKFDKDTIDRLLNIDPRIKNLYVNKIFMEIETEYN